MFSNTKYLIAGLMAVLLSAGQAALVAADSSQGARQFPASVERADPTVDRAAPSAYHPALPGFASRRDSDGAQR